MLNILSNIKEITIVISSLFAVVMLFFVNKLKKDNKELKNQVEIQKKTFKIEQEASDAETNTKNCDISGNIKRLSK